MTEEKRPGEVLEEHLKNWQDIGSRMQTVALPALKKQLELERLMGPNLLGLQKSFRRSFEPILSMQNEWRSRVASIEASQKAMSDVGLLAERVNTIRQSLFQNFTPAFTELQRTFRELPLKTREALMVLGNHGWYLDFDMLPSFLGELKNALEEGDSVAAEVILCQHFEERLSAIEASTADRFPARSQIVRAAFSAHRRHEYELSIPVLLAQSDGICKEVIGEHFFMKKDKKPRTALYVEQIASETYRAALLSPLAQSLPISASEKERRADFSGLNRHTVLHGESVDYGTKENSLRAISLINYVAHVLDFERDKKLAI
ncbi:hypothetical protein GM160_04235 [Guyparkeria halophila]|uniref:Uncharacterized protein n=1 Tax=Guyparkeria halophila TaxID=47960 RepID=A0A6I6CZT8_9GAMM|nr:hypothetical protein [Guyparkeria halophila]QGT78168.1 hypothetical protein GM160_04235 [Guyparkeria halophila]